MVEIKCAHCGTSVYVSEDFEYITDTFYCSVHCYVAAQPPEDEDEETQQEE